MSELGPDSVIRRRRHYVPVSPKAEIGGPRPSVMGPMRSSPPCDRHAAELTLLSVVDAKAATLCC